ncbi:hypothetical protein F5Y19DRAFT_89454 [Xylariaceae sp. FL1651]|nr:hypothetical protein F5Y19DRAFT_89454 [Xylariaceae sp. FL1651]
MMFQRRRSHAPSSHYSGSTRHHWKEPEADSQYDQCLRGRIAIDLFDLDAPATERQDIKIGARKTSNLGHVASFLKRRFSEEPHKIPREAHIEFFWSRKKLDGNEIPKGISTLWYRVLSPEDDGTFQIIWRDTGQPVSLRLPQLDQLAQDIESGATLGQLRHTIASTLQATLPPDGQETIEPNQITIEALGGLRPGPLQGNQWELRNVKLWLCRYLKIGVVASRDYFVLSGLNEEYVWHSPRLEYDRATSALCVKIWLKGKIILDVQQYGGDLSGITVDDIKLFFHGKAVKDSDRFRPGVSIQFELSRHAGDSFVQAEAWLLPLTETCSICADEKRVSEMPSERRITNNCTHEATACKECISHWITSSMETVAWDRLKCLECSELLEFKDVKAFAAKDAFERYDKLATRAALDSMQGFQWCFNPRCDAGQIYSSRCSKAKCYACKHYSCAYHNVPWHSGETCEEYDRRTRKQRKSDKLSEQHVKETSKPCPGCKKNVYKYSGCDHITCICGHEWCWMCFSTYTRDNNSFLRCKHTRQCRYHTNPPMWERGGQFMPFMPQHGGPPRPPGPPEPHGPLGARPFPGLPIRPEGGLGPPAPRQGQDRPRPPQMPLPADVIDFIFGGDQNGQGARPRQPPHGLPFLNDALIFDFLQLMERGV